MIGFKEAVKFGFIGYFNFTTRSSRSEFWWWVLFTLLVGVILTIVNSVLFGASTQISSTGEIILEYNAGYLGFIFQLGVFIPSIAVGCRRLHDIDRSGWWQLLALTPLISFGYMLYGGTSLLLLFTPLIIGWGLLLYFFVRRGDSGWNRFGPNPNP